MNTPTKAPKIGVGVARRLLQRVVRGRHEKTLRKVTMKFFEEIECEHGWTDDKGFAHCDLGSSCYIGMESFCTKEDCMIYEEDEEDEEDT